MVPTIVIIPTDENRLKKSIGERPVRAGSGILILPMAVALFAVVTGSGFAGQAHTDASPCTVGISTCSEWVKLAAEPQRLLVYRSYPLEAANQSITRALVLVHGGGRNASDSFKTALAAAFLAGALEDTILVAPRFASNTGAPANDGRAPCMDTLAPDEASWGCEDQTPDSWRNGSPAIGNGKLTSYDFVDEILRKLARKEVFPNLKRIVIAGHSGGGQFTLRYAMANQSHDKLGVTITYVVSNPDQFVYLDTSRPTAAAYPVAASAPGFVPSAPADRFVQFADARNCGTYNDWQYGLENRTGYTARLTDEQLRRQLSSRPITYLLGALDILPVAGFDDSCPAMAQGPTRFARGMAFGKYLTEKYGAKHNTIVVPNCGHNDRCMFTANDGFPLLFPREP